MIPSVIDVPELYRDREYTLLVRDVWTKSGGRLSREPLQYHFYMDMGRETPEYIQNDLLPEVERVHVSPSVPEVEITFSKAVTPETAEKRSNYQITLAEDLSREIKIDKVELAADSVTALLTLMEPLNYEEGYRYIKGIRDYLGREMHPRADYFRPGWEGETPDNDHFHLIRVLSDREIEIVFGRELGNLYQPTNYAIAEFPSGKPLSIVAVEEGWSPNSVRLFLREELSKGEDYLISAGRGILDTDGKPIETFTDRITAEFASLGPRVEKVEALDRSYFRLIFDKPVHRLEVDLSGFDLQAEIHGEVVLLKSSMAVFPKHQIGSVSEPGKVAVGVAGETLTLSSTANLQVREVKAPPVTW